MKNKITKTLLLLIAGAISISANAQSSSASSNSKKLFLSYGYSPLLGFEKSPLCSFTALDNSLSTPAVDAQTIRISTYDIFTYIFKLRYNLVEFDKNHSLSVAALPAIGFGISYLSGTYVNDIENTGDNGYLSFNLPLMFEYNLGNVATYSSDQDRGFVAGIGIEYTKAPLLKASMLGGQYQDVNGNFQDISTLSLSTSWVEPVFELGYRFWNKNNKAREIALKLGTGSDGALSARLSWSQFIGY